MTTLEDMLFGLRLPELLIVLDLESFSNAPKSTNYRSSHTLPFPLDVPTADGSAVAVLALGGLDFETRPRPRPVGDRPVLDFSDVLGFCSVDAEFGFLNATARENGSDLKFARARLSEKLPSAELARAIVPPGLATAARIRDDDRGWICSGKTIEMVYDTLARHPLL